MSTTTKQYVPPQLTELARENSSTELTLEARIAQLEEWGLIENRRVGDLEEWRRIENRRQIENQRSDETKRIYEEGFDAGRAPMMDALRMLLYAVGAILLGWLVGSILYKILP